MRMNAGKLVGEWSGRNSLWLAPGEPVRHSATEATVTTAAAGQFLVITYSWSDKGEPHDGLLMVRVADDPSPLDMVWVDSFHTMRQFMRFEGRESGDGSIEATTKWSPGSGPDWGWRIAVSSAGPDHLVVRMFIETPDGQEAPAVESVYSRKAAAS